MLWYLFPDGHTEEDIQLTWRTTNDVQISDDLEMPQFKLTEITTGKCSISYITGDRQQI